LPVFDLYSRRKKQRERAGVADPYQYDNLPGPFRVQVAHILEAAIGRFFVDSYGFKPSSPANKAWELIRKVMLREHGLQELPPGGRDPQQECLNFLLDEENTDSVLDLIEVPSE